MAKTDERGFWQDSEGRYIHPDMVRVDKQLEDEIVEKMVARAKEMHEILVKFKAEMYAQCESFLDMLRQHYGIDRTEKSKTGAMTLKNFNNTKEVQIAISKLISFDNKLSLAKEKIDEYLDEKTENADSEIRTLITRAFDVKNGKVDPKQILSLKQYPITNPKWKEAMAMIDESTEITGTKSYIRFRENKDGEISGKKELIVLDLANV